MTQGRPLRGTNPAVVLSAVAMATFLVSLSTSSLGVAVPAVSRHFHASPLASTLIVITPPLTSTTLLLALGRVGDLLGRRWCYLLGLSTFTVASLLLGFAPAVWMFVGLQVCQAAGVAAVWANSAAILLDALDARQFHRGLGIYVSAISVADLVGPTVGGAITQAIGWRGIFWVNALVGAACALWGWHSLPRRLLAREPFRFDVVGAALLIVGLGGFVVSLLIAQSGTGLSTPIVGAAIGSLLVLVLFVVNEIHVTTPLVHIEMFKNRAFSLAMASGFLNAMAQWVPALLMVLFFQALRGDTPLRAGLTVMPLPVFAGSFSASAGYLSRFLAPPKLAVVGSAISAVGLTLVALTLTAPYPLLAISLAVAGAGSGIFSPAIANALMMGAPAADAGLVNGTRLTLQNVGWVASTALALVVITAPLPVADRHQFFTGTAARVSSTTVSKLLQGYHHSLALLAAIAAAAAVMALLSARAATRPQEHPVATVR